MVRAAVIEKQNWWAAQCGEDDVHPAVVIDVPESSSARGQRRSYPRIDALEATIVIDGQQRHFFVAQRSIDLLHIVQDVALRHEEVLPAVIIEVFETHAPTGAAGR